MDTQVDRLLLNPNIVEEGFEELRQMPFESLLQDAIRVGKAVKAADWSIEPKHNLAWRPSSYQPAEEPAEEPAESVATADEEMSVESESFNDARRALRGKPLDYPLETPSQEALESSENPSVPPELPPQEATSEEATPKKFVLEKVVHREPPSNPVGHAPPMGGTQRPQSSSTPKNTSVPSEGIMIGGPVETTSKPADPWGPAPAKVKTIPVGAKIKM